MGEKQTIIKADSVFFPEEGLKNGLFLLIKDGVISEITHDIKGYEDLPITDFSGYTISPPFCDYHIHLPRRMGYQIDDLFESLASYGLLEVFEGGDKDKSGIEIRDSLRGKLRVRASGQAICKKNSYGSILGISISDSSEARDVIDGLLSWKVNYIKIINSGVFNPDTAEITTGGFSPDELKEIMEYSGSKGLEVFCHANGDRAIRDAVEAGVSAIVHGFLVSEETLHVMHERGTAFIPTINALHSLKKVYDRPDTVRNIDMFAGRHLEAISRAHEIGLRVLPGSDAGPIFIPYGSSYPEELGFFEKAGIPEGHILASAAAAAGPLEVGKRADFLVLNGLSAYAVFIGGKEVFSERYKNTHNRRFI